MRACLVTVQVWTLLYFQHRRALQVLYYVSTRRFYFDTARAVTEGHQEQGRAPAERVLWERADGGAAYGLTRVLEVAQRTSDNRHRWAYWTRKTDGAEDFYKQAVNFGPRFCCISSLSFRTIGVATSNPDDTAVDLACDHRGWICLLPQGRV